MKSLPPQRLTDAAWSDVERQLVRIFRKIIFDPVLAVLEKNNAQPVELRNTADLSSLIAALRSGRVQYTNGIFSGKFSIAISNDIRSFGGRFDSRAKTYSAPITAIPAVVRAEAASYQTNARLVHEELKRVLDDTQRKLADDIWKTDVNAAPALAHIESGFKKSAEELTIEPKLDPDNAAQVKSDYNDNMKLWIHKFSKESIQDLRDVVEDNALQGYRFDRMKDAIVQRYGVTKNKAKFLARQETALFMAKYREQRFSQAGVKRYQWSTAHDERVRESHKHLNGRVFSYDQPPITDTRTGQRNNPGQDYNCRCLDIPLLEPAGT